ncbi:MAG: M20/M25/M40 family metallo-hydrolase, partial [Rikenellaceae bacterium]|nr:M20/M25/M40 family metallo-hydrolase [Rikenellaceae bacterium]
MIQYREYLELLRHMIRLPAYSGEEAAVSELIHAFLSERRVAPHRKGNNIWAFGRNYDPEKPTILLNSHLDTVKPNNGYTRDPFEPSLEGDRLYGLGSTDAGASVVSLLAVFLELQQRPLPFNICLALTAEEERSGTGDIESIWEELG